MSAHVPPPPPPRIMPNASSTGHAPRPTAPPTPSVAPTAVHRAHPHDPRRPYAHPSHSPSSLHPRDDPNTYSRNHPHLHAHHNAHLQRSTSPPPPVNEISRERYILTGGETGAPIVPSIPSSHLHGRRPKPGRGAPTRTTAWEFVPFNNGARSDNLKLKHWQRVGTPAEYPFARFDRPIRFVTYTDDEYSRVIEPTMRAAHGVRMQAAHTTLQQKQEKKHKNNRSSSGNGTRDTPSAVLDSMENALGAANTRRSAAAASSPSLGSTLPPSSSSSCLPPPPPPPPPPPNATATGATGGSLRHGLDHVPTPKAWTKPETDELFNLCSHFDLRFPVISDRWPTHRFSGRSIDELKDRYYSVSKAIIELRAKNEPARMAQMPVALQKHCQAIVMNPFDYEYECIRKNQLEYQYGRSKAELREEEETVREARRIEANRRRNLKERQRLVKLLAPSTVSNSDGSQADAMTAMAAASSTLAPQKTFPHRKVSTGPFARSSLVFAPVSQSSKVCKRVDAGLEELDVSLRPMPTCTVVDNFDLLRIDILNILELNRTVAKKEEEVYSLRVKLAKSKGEPVPPPPPGVPSSHKKRRVDDVEVGPIFGGRVS